MGLVEMAMVLACIAILLGMTIPIVSTVFDVTGRVDNTYKNVSQQVVMSTLPERMIRAAVAPDPNPNTGSPVPAFCYPGTGSIYSCPTSLTPTSVTFFANMGNTNGPDEVTAGCPAGTTTMCSGPFTVTVTPPTAGSCPFSTTSTNDCRYSSSATQTVVTVTSVQNSSTEPLFVYSYGAVAPPGQSMTVTKVTPTASYPTYGQIDSHDFSSCTSSTNPSQPYANCLAGEVQEVDFQLLVNVNTNSRHGGLTVEEDSSVFTLSSISMTYDPSVG